MKNLGFSLNMIFFLIATTFGCKSQNKEGKNCSLLRQPVYAGKFYESDSIKLGQELDGYFKTAVPHAQKKVLAIICPHAGYVFSGKVAASSYNQVDPDFQYKNVFILAPSHYYAFDGASVYNLGNFSTPLGEVPVNCDLGNELIKKSSIIKSLPEAHAKEHAIEVQLPFIQKKLKKGYKIIPIIIGTQDTTKLKKIAEVLKDYLKPENLFVISSDFTHYPSYKDAKEVDKQSAQTIAMNSPQALDMYLRLTESKNINKLVTCMCGQAGIMCLLFMSSKMENVEYNLVDYKNSGDSEYGDKESVVGYWAISLVKKDGNTESKTSFELNKDDKEKLLSIARKTLEEFIKKDKTIQLDSNDYSKNLRTKCGAFVSLTIKGQLRGCVGSFAVDMPLYQVVRDMAISASSEDPRFHKVKETELKNIEIEISVLTPMHKIDSVSQIEIGKHGIYIKNGNRRGTLLPQVAPGNHWNAQEFVKYCALYKAGIDENEIKNSELYVYEAIVFKEKEK